MAADGNLAAITPAPIIEDTSSNLFLHVKSPAASSSSELRAERIPLLCVIDVPRHLNYADFCRFCGPFVPKAHLLFRRNNEAEDGYCVLIKFATQSSADSFHEKFNGMRFPSLEGDVCNVQFVQDERMIRPAEKTACAECCEPLDRDNDCILTALCEHSFHYTCLEKWRDSSCPVCRYSYEQPDESSCSDCECSDDLWICALCCYVGCGWYKNGHSIAHWKETKHSYALEFGTQKLWNFDEENYVHRLIYLETLEDSHGNAAKSEDTLSVAELAIQKYNDFLVSLLKEQKNYLERDHQNKKKEMEEKVDQAIREAKDPKLQHLENKCANLEKSKENFNKMNEELNKTVEELRLTLSSEKTRAGPSIKQKEVKSRMLEQQLQTLKTELKGKGIALELSTVLEKEKDVTSTSSKKKKSRKKKKEN